jgi:hypothetical protein
MGNYALANDKDVEASKLKKATCSSRELLGIKERIQRTEAKVRDNVPDVKNNFRG